MGNNRTLASTAVGAAPFVEEALRWLPDSEYRESLAELPPGHELIPVPCPPLAGSDAVFDSRPLILIADDNADMRQYLLSFVGGALQRARCAGRRSRLTF